MTEEIILEEIRKVQKQVRDLHDTVVALKMGAISFDGIDRQFRDVKGQLNDLRSDVRRLR